MLKEEKNKIKEYQRKKCQQLIRMSEKTLKFDNIRVSKNEFHKSKQPINLGLINVDEIVVSDAKMVLNVLLVTKKVKLLNRYVLSYHKWVDT